MAQSRTSHRFSRALSEGEKIIAEIAPAFVGQFGDNITPRNIKAALRELGFSEVFEVALGADIGAVAEAHHYVNKVVTGELLSVLGDAGEEVLPGRD